MAVAAVWTWISHMDRILLHFIGIKSTRAGTFRDSCPVYVVKWAKLLHVNDISNWHCKFCHAIQGTLRRDQWVKERHTVTCKWIVYDVGFGLCKSAMHSMHYGSYGVYGHSIRTKDDHNVSFPLSFLRAMLIDCFTHRHRNKINKINEILIIQPVCGNSTSDPIYLHTTQIYNIVLILNYNTVGIKRFSLIL